MTPSPTAHRRRSVSKESSLSQCASPPPGFLRSGSAQALFPRTGSGSGRAGEFVRCSVQGLAGRGVSPHFGLVQQLQPQTPLLLNLEHDQAGNRAGAHLGHLGD